MTNFQIRELMDEAREILDIESLGEKLSKFYYLCCKLPSGYSYLEDITTAEGICKRLEKEAREGNLQSIAILLHDITDYTQEIYGVDGYANYYTLTVEDVDDWLGSIIGDLDNELDDEEEDDYNE